MGESGDPSVKKRSLSSYLSNVSLRREELEKLKKKQEEEEQEMEKKETEENQRSIVQQQQEQETQERLRKDQETQPSLQQTNTTTERGEQATVHSSPNSEDTKELKSDKDDTAASINETKDEDEKHLSQKEPGNYDASVKSSESLRSSTDQHNIHRNSSFTRQELHSILKEPKRQTDTEQARHGMESDRPPKLGGNGDEESDVASDAPTEPASPPRPRRGRLIRGVRLQSMSPSHSTFDNESDSELSDIDELKSIQISSSIIHGDSSPIKSTQDDIRRRHHVSSPRMDRGRTGSPRQLKPHISTPKNSRQKKGVYRDAGGRTRLQISCDKGNYEQAKKLIEENYNVNDQDNAGNTALHEAALNGHLEIVKLLIRNGADVNMQSFKMFKDTPLIDASANGHLDVVKYLLSHGADPTICNAKGLTAYESIEEDSDLDEQEQEIVSEIKHHLRSAAKHWKSDSKAHSLSLAKDTHLDNLSQGRQESEELLGDFEFYWTDITSRAGKQKLLKASKEGKLPYVGSYLENGGRVDLKSFFEAVKLGHEDVTSLFLAFGAQVNAVSKDGTTALISAVGRGHVGTVRLLLEAGADPRKKDKNGKTALYHAENSPMGVVDSEEVALIRKAILKFADKPGDVEEKTGKRQISELKQSEGRIDKRSVKQEDSNEDEDENVISVARKRRTVSPVRFDTKRHATSVTANAGESPEHVEIPQDVSKKSSVEPESAKVQEETPKEKEQRIKAEEEYIQRRLQNKRKKEQELLKKLALDEEQKEKERAEQRIKEAEKMEEQQRLKKIQLDNQKKEHEILKRRQIRSLYPLGLRLIDFTDTEDQSAFLPLYYAELGDDKARYVLDLHLCVIFKNQTPLMNSKKIPVAMKHKKQLWNILKSTFLYGGPKNRDRLNWESMDMQSRMQFETQEYIKFSNLPMNWVKLQDIDLNEMDRRELEQEMVQIALVEASEDPVLPRIPVAKQAAHPAHALALPNRLRRRHTVTQLLQNYNTQSLW